MWRSGAGAWFNGTAMQYVSLGGSALAVVFLLWGLYEVVNGIGKIRPGYMPLLLIVLLSDSIVAALAFIAIIAYGPNGLLYGVYFSSAGLVPVMWLFVVYGFAYSTMESQHGARESFVKKLLDALPMGVLVVDRGGAVVYHNAFLAQTDRAAAGPDEILRLCRAGNGEPLPPAENPWRAAIAGRKVFLSDIEFDDGASRRPCTVWGSPVVVEERDAFGVVVLRDNTDRKRLEERLAQTQKLESLGRLAGGVAHDFNNLLVVILGYCEMLKAATSPETEHYDDLLQIEQAGRQASALTAQLLAFSRNQLIAPREVQLDAAVRSAEKMIARIIGEDVRVESRLADDTGAIRTDPGQVEQLLLNLAVNARDAMPDGGLLSFETRNVEVTAEYAQQNVDLTPGKYVMLAVSDTGVGMDEATRLRVFEPFFTTKKEGHGTGLGLATVYGIVKQAGGDIHVYSEPGRGTTFRLYFPLISRSGAAVKQDGSGTEPLAPAAGATILVAEDADGPRQLVQRILEQAGYRVLAAESAESALALAGEHDGPIDLLLSDVVMPGGGGPELAAALTAIRPEARILYMTGYTDNVALRQGLLRHDVEVLQKPFAPDDLVRAVRRILAQR